MTTANLIEIFCILDEFCKFFAPELKKHTIQVPGKRHRNRPSRMSDSEIMTILILFHTRRFRDLKSFYLGYVCQHMRKDFPNPVSYNRFVERQAQVGLHLLLFLQTCALGKCTGISIIDSTPLVSCHIKREKQHKTMKGWAAKGKCTMGWFYGFKLHLICNEKGDLLNFMVTPGNVDDREPLRNKSFIEQIFGKLVGDKGYVCKELFSRLFVDGIQLITKLKNNMKGQIMTVTDKILLRKRALIETINDELKNMAQIEHSRHRSIAGFTVNLMAGLAAYSFFPKKPMIDVERVSPYESGLIQLSLF